jgi:hypothetical protein
MADEPQDPDSNEPDDEFDDDDDEVSSPFDHPFFLPVLLFAFAAWFGYDGWLNEDFAKESADSLSFNRYGFGALLVAAIYYTVKGVREKRDSE